MKWWMALLRVKMTADGRAGTVQNGCYEINAGGVCGTCGARVRKGMALGKEFENIRVGETSGVYWETISESTMGFQRWWKSPI